MSYKVGDMVVYPRHGAAKVEAITERTVKGVTREYLQLSVLSSDGLVINVPVDNAKKVGVRDIALGEIANHFGDLVDIAGGDLFDVQLVTARPVHLFLDDRGPQDAE